MVELSRGNPAATCVFTSIANLYDELVDSSEGIEMQIISATGEGGVGHRHWLPEGVQIGQRSEVVVELPPEDAARGPRAAGYNGFCRQLDLGRRS